MEKGSLVREEGSGLRGGLFLVQGQMEVLHTRRRGNTDSVNPGEPVLCMREGDPVRSDWHAFCHLGSGLLIAHLIDERTNGIAPG